MNSAIRFPMAFDGGPLSNDEMQRIDQPGPSHRLMSDYWRQVDTIIDGIAAMRRAGETYLPKFPHESADDYKFRLATSRMTNVYRDIVESLASKPFVQETHLIEPNADKKENESAFVTPELLAYQEDIDGRGSHLHVFSSEAFFRAVNASVHWILVDYPEVNRSVIRTVADETAAKIRPYWVQIPAINMLDAKTRVVNGIEEIAYVRIWEPSDDADRVRVFKYADATSNVVVFEIYKRKKAVGSSVANPWTFEKGGALTIDKIPLVPIVIGRRRGNTFATYPPLRDAADLQIELYQDESGLKNIKDLTCYPMLAANGVAPAKDADGNLLPVPMGPKVVLFAPPDGSGGHGEWARIASDAPSLQFLAANIDTTIKNIREIGRQPLTAQSGGITRISAAISAGKGNTAVQAWVSIFKDALEQAMLLTLKWMNVNVPDGKGPEVFVFDDFDVEDAEDATPDILMNMRKGNDLSQETLWEEMKRRGVLSAEFDAEKEAERLLNEVGGSNDGTIDPITGLPIVPPNNPTPPNPNEPQPPSNPPTPQPPTN